MLLNEDYIYPAELTGYVRNALEDYAVNQFSLAQWLPNKMIDDLDYRLLSGGTGLADAASFRSFDAESPIGRHQQLSVMRGELPPMSEKQRCGEYDRLRMRKVTDQKVVEQLFNDAERVTRNIAARVELARGDALVNGSVTIAENGLGQFIDFGRNPAHSVTAANLWSSATSDPLNDIMSWRDTYLATNGLNPAAMLVSRRIWNNLLRNQSIRNQVFGGQALYVGGGQGSIINQDQLNNVFAAQGLPQVTLYQAQVNVNGVAQRVIPDNKAVLLPEPVAIDAPEDTMFGATFWGTTAESLDPRWGLEGDEAGIVSGVYSEEDPISLWTKGAALVLPGLANPNLSFVASVL